MALGPSETLFPVETPPRSLAPAAVTLPEPATWWERLTTSLSRLTHAALSVLEADSRFIAETVAPRRAGHFDSASWPESRIRRGIVVGSVQSGKTANMLAVSSHALDRGVGLLIILAGTRVALWLQTYERFLGQLDRSSPDEAWRRNSRRVLVPDPADVLGEAGRVDPRQYLRSQRARFVSAIRGGAPAILIVPKIDAHLLELGRFLRETLSASALDARGRPLEMVVLDDEADDGSVLEASDGEKVTPRFIQHLWSDPAEPDSTWHANLFATYVAYTATPQANFLQAQHNPLAPRDFRAALRVPFEVGSITGRRSTTYREPEGAKRYYSGGRIFYELLAPPPGSLLHPLLFPVQESGEPNDVFAARVRAHQWESLGDALRSYFVAGALRLIFASRQLSAVAGHDPTSRPTLEALLPPPHCMLFHPSALKEEHFRGAEDISRWCSALPGAESQADVFVDSDGIACLDSAGLVRRLHTEEAQWKRWVQEYDDSTFASRMLPKGTYRLPSDVSWEAVKTTLCREVFPHTKLRVLNSDPRAADRPIFEPIPADGSPGKFLPPPEIFSIFVAGNVLSRGLTIEGLSTSLFQRSAEIPAADTQMQMQRWFGYRGDYLPLCRLFAYDDQLELFSAYHLNDEALKTEILAEMDLGETEARGPLVLRGDTFLATAKVDTRKVPLHPGPTPAIRLVNRPHDGNPDPNINLLAQLLDSRAFHECREPADLVRGLISEEPLEMLEVALLLEKLRYDRHRPSPTDDLYSRWRSLALAYGIPHPLLQLPGPPFVRSGVEPSTCPYSVAAYLRLWDALLSMRDARGVYPTDRPGQSWHLINLAEYQAARPRFYVGIRFGDEGLARHPDLRRHRVHLMRRGFTPTRGLSDFVLETLWGSRGRDGTYFGDQLMDYHYHRRTPVPRLHDGLCWRPRGHPGLVLFHVIRDAEGREMLALGLGLPHGGPDHIAALRGNRGRAV